MSDYDIITQLRESKRIIGSELSPMIIDSDTENLSGRHREQAGFTRTYHVDTKQKAQQWKVPRQVAKEMIRLHANIQRKVKGMETKATLLRIAEAFEQEGKTPLNEICVRVAEVVPHSNRYVRQLLPDKYKQMEHANEPELVPQKTPLKARFIKPKETWEFITARRKPPKSRIEVEAISELILEGHDLETDVEFCIEKIRPDAIHRRKRIAFEIDGEKVHRKRQDKDYVRRERFAKLHKYTVVSVTYSAYSKRKKEEIKQAFREALQE